MRISLLTLSVLLGLHLFATDVPGGNVSGTWTAAGSPYLIQGDIRVPAGETLTLEPGTHVQFTGPYFLRILGNFSAQGNELDSVRFESETESTWWKGIKMDSLQVESDTTIFEYCVIRRMQNTGIHIINTSKVRISHARISENSQMYIGSIYCALGNPTITHTRFADNDCSSGSEAAAMYIWDASPLITDCTFVRNHSNWSAGAITVYRGDIPTEPVFERCLFEDNSTYGSGGAVVLHSNVPSTFTDCTFRDNWAQYNGGAIWDGYTLAGTHQYTRCTFENNGCEDKGGALYIVGSQSAYIDCRFTGNYTLYQGGGAIYAYDDNLDLQFERSQFVGNTADGQGGAMYVGTNAALRMNRCKVSGNSGIQGGALYLSYYVDAVLTNSIFTNNSTSSWGGAFYFVQFTNPVITNCVIANNVAGGKGGAMGLYWQASPQVTNSIIWGNMSEDGISTYAVNEYIWNYCVPSFENCAVEGGTTSFVYDTSGPGVYENAVESDPLFAGPTAGPGVEWDSSESQWSVLDDSPCIDAGSGTVEELGLDAFDFYGLARVQGESIDIGAWEGAHDVFDAEADFNGDGTVDTEDLLLLLGNFGCTGGCEPDLNGDGNTGAADLLEFLGMIY